MKSGLPNSLNDPGVVTLSRDLMRSRGIDPDADPLDSIIDNRDERALPARENERRMVQLRDDLDRAGWAEIDKNNVAAVLAFLSDFAGRVQATAQQ